MFEQFFEMIYGAFDSVFDYVQELFSACGFEFTSLVFAMFFAGAIMTLFMKYILGSSGSDKATKQKGNNNGNHN